jgi:4-hydroxy-3-methylbut-2-en-1-yl diphosphate reductase
MISGKIRKKYPKLVKVFDTLCLATHSRQTEIKEMAKSNDVMLIIGSSKSANSTHLWEIAKKINPNSYFIKNGKKIHKKWFKNYQKVGISAGASTPPWIIEEVCFFIGNKL